MAKARKFLLRGLAAVFSLMLASHTTAQTFTTLYSFTDGSDGANPQAGLLLSGDTLYGTTTGGGSSGKGTVFAVNTDGTGFTTLYSFTNGSDGRNPEAGLVLSGRSLYGTAYGGGSSGNGTVFAVNTDGTGFTTLYTFTATSGSEGFIGTNSDGTYPRGGLVLSGNTLYETARDGGAATDGTVFAVNTDGTGFSTLHSFTARSGLTLTNSDGAYPGPGGLILSGDTLYGTAVDGGSSDGGTVFAVNTDGTAFITLYSFTGGSDGGNPQTKLVLSGNTLYGTAESGGHSGDGTVFAVNADGSDFTTLYSFTGGSDGSQPLAGLILSGDTLYGTAWGYNSSGEGTVFALNTDGTGFTTLYSFTGGSDGGNPQAELVLSDGTLYGTASVGGIGYGTVFSLSLPPVSAPQMAITLSGTNVVLTWPASPIEFTLQFTASLGSPVVWTTNSPAPVLVNGQNTVTNLISGTQQFYRLSQ